MDWSKMNFLDGAIPSQMSFCLTISPEVLKNIFFKVGLLLLLAILSLVIYTFTCLSRIMAAAHQPDFR